MKKAQKKIAEQNLQKAVEVTTMFAENAVSEGKAFCICNVDVGLDVTAVREAVSKVMKDKVSKTCTSEFLLWSHGCPFKWKSFYFRFL